MHRRKLIGNVISSIGAASLLPLHGFTQQDTVKPPPLDINLVKEFVTAGHNNLEKVKTLLIDHPELIFATFDHGGGDFETALEGAGHVGNKDIAKFLIDAGARPNLFVLAMLGKTSIVIPFLDAYPQYLSARGPHGFTLLHHATRGGSDAEEIREYLSAMGLKEMRLKLA